MERLGNAVATDREDPIHHGGADRLGAMDAVQPPVLALDGDPREADVGALWQQRHAPLGELATERHALDVLAQQPGPLEQFAQLGHAGLVEFSALQPGAQDRAPGGSRGLQQVAGEAGGAPGDDQTLEPSKAFQVEVGWSQAANASAAPPRLASAGEIDSAFQADQLLLQSFVHGHLGDAQAPDLDAVHHGVDLESSDPGHGYTSSCEWRCSVSSRR